MTKVMLGLGAAAGPMLQFNTKKKRLTISAGRIRDYEAGTLFLERLYKKGKKRTI